MLDWKWLEQLVKNPDEKIRYMFLSRMKQDCEYYLGYGNRNPNHLWGLNEVDHIKAMKILWFSFGENEKPEWLTFDDILYYEEQMCNRK